MMRLGSAATMDAYHRGLVTPGHRREIQVLILDLDGNLISHATYAAANRVLGDSAVDYDVTRIPTRILTLNLLDPSGVVDWEPTSPGEASLARSRMVQVIDSRYISELGRWVDCPVFTGPIQPESSREGAHLRIVAHGLEVQAMGAMWKRRVFGAKRPKTWIIKELLSECGEDRLGGIPDRGRTTPHRIVVDRHKPAWPLARKLAASMNDALFYNGRGHPVERPRTTKAVLTIDGVKIPGRRPAFPALLGDVEMSNDQDEGYNTFEVIGKNPKGPKEAPRAVVMLPPRHPNSPKSLKRNGQPFHVVLSETREHVKTRAECKAIAKRKRREALKVTTSFSLDLLPIPHLEEYDVIRVRTLAGNYMVTMRQWSLPLYDEGAPAMTVTSQRRRVAS